MPTKTRRSATQSRIKKNKSSDLQTVPSHTPKILTEEKSQVVNTSKTSPSSSTSDATLQLLCTQNDLATHLELVSHAVPAKPTHPILGNVLLVACSKTQRVYLSVFNLSLAIQTSFEAKVNTPGETTIPAELLSEIVRKFSSGDLQLSNSISLNTENNPLSTTKPEQNPILTLVSASGRYQVRGLSSDEFPSIPEVNSYQNLAMAAEALKSGIKGALFATATDETKQILTGVHLKMNSNTLELAATDGHRLAVVETSIQGFKKNKETENTEPLQFTLPAKSLLELERILASRTSAESVQLSYNLTTGYVEFSWGVQRLITRCLEGEYPAYQDLLNHDFQHQVYLEKLPFVKALERLSVLADKKEKIINIDFSPENQQVSLSLLREFGNGREEMTAIINFSHSFSISFNIKYLLEGIKAIASSEISIHLIDSDHPAILKPFGNREQPHLLIDSQYLLMPVVKS
ncbi:MAG: DNA polymerase III subunit beta [Planktothrix sp.]|uniref:DNA polymerase III subunit beta n=1 Tax=Planktothrix sp. TaxID=3088171 RepID=UPI0038D3BC2E